MDISAPEFQANLQIPIDLFVSKSSGAEGGGGLRFTDSSGNLVFRVERQPPKSSYKRVLVDASGNHLIYIHRNQVILSLSLSTRTRAYRFWLDIELKTTDVDY